MIDNKDSCKSWFCVLNNPQNYFDGDEKEIAEKVLEIWIDDKPTRTGAVAYCVSAGGLHHLHMVFEDSNKSRFSALKKLFPKAHLEPTKGNKEQAENYISKKGKYEEKGEKVLYVARFGEIKGFQGQRKDLEIIESYLQDGKTPKEILSENFSFRRYDGMIRKAYFDERCSNTPFIRNVNVYWHIGESGSGKSFTCQKLIHQYGEDNVYFLTDFKNGGFDNYCGEKILFIDEFRGQIPYSTILTILGGYKAQIHTRYSNVAALWDEVHITSVLTPQMCYDDHLRNTFDTIDQLIRRIDFIDYHFMRDGQYLTFEIPMSEFISYDDLKYRASGYKPVLEIPSINFDEFEEIC